MSEDGEFLGIAGFHLDDFLDVDGILGGGLGDEERCVSPLDGLNVDDVSAEGGSADGRLTAVHEGIRVTSRSLGEDLTDDLAAGRGECDWVIDSALLEESSNRQSLALNEDLLEWERHIS